MNLLLCGDIEQELSKGSHDTPPHSLILVLQPFCQHLYHPCALCGTACQPYPAANATLATPVDRQTVRPASRQAKGGQTAKLTSRDYCQYVDL